MKKSLNLKNPGLLPPAAVNAIALVKLNSQPQSKVLDCCFAWCSDLTGKRKFFNACPLRRKIFISRGGEGSALVLPKLVFYYKQPAAIVATFAAFRSTGFINFS